MVGSLGYVAPEVFKREPYDVSADIWSLGALMLALISGELPFHEDDERELERRVCTEPLNLESSEETSSLSCEAKDLLHCMLRKCPLERITIK